jgi:hypothetical protein
LRCVALTSFVGCRMNMLYNDNQGCWRGGGGQEVQRDQGGDHHNDFLNEFRLGKCDAWWSQKKNQKFHEKSKKNELI